MKRRQRIKKNCGWRRDWVKFKLGAIVLLSWIGAESEGHNLPAIVSLIYGWSRRTARSSDRETSRLSSLQPQTETKLRFMASHRSLFQDPTRFITFRGSRELSFLKESLISLFIPSAPPRRIYSNVSLYSFR